MEEPVWLTETRDSYDVVAGSYAEQLAGALEESEADREQLAALADAVGPRARVVDVGCGPGRLTGHLAALGLDASGLDLSPGMVAEARRRHPGLAFEVGSLLDLPFPDGELDGVLAWYSLIHLPPDHLPAAIAELHRVLATGGVLLAAFQVGDERRRIAEGYGHQVGLDAWRMDPDRFVEHLVATGFTVASLVVRQATGRETTPQAYVRAVRG